MINCANNSNNKKIFKNETYFNIFYYLTNITVSSTKDTDINNWNQQRKGGYKNTF